MIHRHLALAFYFFFIVVLLYSFDSNLFKDHMTMLAFGVPILSATYWFVVRYFDEFLVSRMDVKLLSSNESANRSILSFSLSYLFIIMKTLVISVGFFLLLIFSYPYIPEKEVFLIFFLGGVSSLFFVWVDYQSSVNSSMRILQNVILNSKKRYDSVDDGDFKNIYKIINDKNFLDSFAIMMLFDYKSK